MNKTLVVILALLAVLALIGGIFLVGTMYARFTAYEPSMMNGFMWGRNTSYGPSEMMNSSRTGMMGGFRDFNNAYIAPLSVDQARIAAEKYLTNLNNPDLQITEIMIFDNNAYVVIKEASTGIGAFELLVDPSSQIAYSEHGPNIMWNLKYADLNHTQMMGGSGNMMGGWHTTNPATRSAQMNVTPEQAITFAQQYLDVNISGATAATDPIQFYGYYTLDFEKDGKVLGMLSVNGYSGQVFLHTWHGSFIEESSME